MKELSKDWKINIEDLLKLDSNQSEQYSLENLKYFFKLNREPSKTLLFYLHYEILNEYYNSFVIISIKNQDEKKDYQLKISFPIKSNGKSKIKIPISFEELTDKNNGWVHDNNSLLLSIIVKIEDLTNLSRENFKVIDYNLDQYSISDIFTITNSKNSISQRISSSYNFGKNDEIEFCFEGKSNSERKIQLDLVFSDLNNSQKFSVYVLFQNRDSNDSKYIYENILFNKENMRHSFIFDINESDFNERNGWIFRGVAQFQFKIANFEFTDFPETVNFVIQHSDYQSPDSMSYRGRPPPSFFDMFGFNHRSSVLSRIGSNPPNINPLHFDHDDSGILNSNHEAELFSNPPFNHQNDNEDVHEFSNDQFDFTSHVTLPSEDDSFHVPYNDSPNINKEEDKDNDIGLAGLTNQGATCYLNSAIQLLFHIPSFRKLVYQIQVDSTSSSQSDLIAHSLQKLFVEMQVNHHGVCSTSNLTKSFGWNETDLITMHDVQEFIRTLIDNLEKKLKGTPLDGEIAKIFRGTSCTVVKAPRVDYESSNKEYFYDLPIDVRGSPNLEESLKNFLKPEKLVGNNMYVIDGYGPQEAEMHTEFIEYPSVLQIHLKRFEYDMQSGMECKINDRFEFPASIDLSPFLSSKSSSEKVDDSRSEEKRLENIYDLYCILVHEGFAYLGHYYAFIRQIIDVDQNGEYKYKEDLNSWYKFNDSTVTKSSYSEAVVNNYGGSYVASSSNNPTMLGDKVFSAYMIVYVRRNKVVDIMKPIKKDEIPAHLQDFIKELDKENNSNNNQPFFDHSFVGFDRPRIDDWNRFEKNELVNLSFMTEDSFFANFTKDFMELNLKRKKLRIKLPEKSSVDEIYRAAEELFGVEEGTIRIWETTGECKPYKPFYRIYGGISGSYFVQVKQKDEPIKPPKPLTYTAFVIFFDASLAIPGQYIGAVQVSKRAEIREVFKFASEALGFPEDTDYLAYRETGDSIPFVLEEPTFRVREKTTIVVLQLKDRSILPSSKFEWKTNEYFIQNLVQNDLYKDTESLPFYNLIEGNRHKLNDAGEYFNTIRKFIYIVVYMRNKPDVPRMRIKYSTWFNISDISEFIAKELKLKYNKDNDSILLYQTYGDSLRIASDFSTSFDDVGIRKQYIYFVQEVRGLNFEQIQKAKSIRILIAFDGFNISYQTNYFIDNETQVFAVVSYLIEEKILKESLFEEIVEEEEDEKVDDDGEDMFRAISWLDEGKIRAYPINNHVAGRVLESEDIIPNNTQEIKFDIVPKNQLQLSQNQILAIGIHRHTVSKTSFACLYPFFFVIDTEERVYELKERLKNSIKLDESWDDCTLYLGKKELNASNDTVKIHYILDKSNIKLTIFHNIQKLRY